MGESERYLAMPRARYEKKRKKKKKEKEESLISSQRTK